MFFKRDGCLKRSDFALRMVQNELDELIFMFWRGAFKCGSMGWGGSRPVIDSRQRLSRERSAMCTLEMFGVLVEDDLRDLIWVCDSIPFDSLLWRNSISWDFDLSDKCSIGWILDVSNLLIAST